MYITDAGYHVAGDGVVSEGGREEGREGGREGGRECFLGQTMVLNQYLVTT